MKIDDEDDFGRCPYCKGTYDEDKRENGMLIVLHDWAEMHSRETLLHCWDCDKKFIVYYKFDRVVELDEREIDAESFRK